MGRTVPTAAAMARNKAMGRSRGFTLIEVLIAITLMAVIVTVGFAVVHTGLRSWDAGEARFQAAEQRATGIGFIRNYLANAMSISEEVAGAPPVFRFAGAPQSVQFVAFPPDQVAHGMMYDFLLYAEGGALRVSMQPHGKPLLAPLPEAEKVVLLDRVRAVSFSYFGSDRDRPGRPTWRSLWRQPYLPDLIAIHIEDAAGVMELEVAPRNGGRP